MLTQALDQKLGLVRGVLVGTRRGVSTRAISILSPGVKNTSGHEVSRSNLIKGVSKKNISPRRLGRKKRPNARVRKHRILLKQRMFVPMGSGQGPAIAPAHTHWG